MNLTLTLTGTASQLAAVLAGLAGDATPTVVVNNAAPVPSMPLPVAALTPPAPISVPLPVFPMPSSADDDDDTGPVNGNAPSLDADGLPWDARIHAKTKVMVAGNKWRKRRGVDDAVVAAVEAELRGAPTAVAPVVMPAFIAPPAPVAIPMPVPVVEAVAPAPVAIPMPMPAPVVEVAPVAAPTGPLDFAQFMQHLSGQIAKQAVNTEYLAGLTVEISNAFIGAGVITQPLGAVTDIATNPQMIDYAVQLLTRDQRW